MTIECGIYCITNTLSGDFYIGSSVNLRKRFQNHQSDLVANCHSNAHLQNSWNKHGMDSFEFSVLEYCEKERVIEREQFYIDSEKPSYNICQIAGSNAGIKLSNETRKRMSEARKGELNPSYGKRGENSYACGKRSDETKRKISEGLKGNSNGMFGKHLSDEAKRRRSEAMTAYRHTEESKRNMSEALKGRHLTEECKRKLSEALLRYWENKRINERNAKTEEIYDAKF